jgi:integrase
LNEATGVSFRRAFDVFFATKRKTLSNRKHTAQWQSTMETYVYPTIGNRPVAEIEAREILDLLTPIWFAKAETAKGYSNASRRSSNLRFCGAIANVSRRVSASRKNLGRVIRRHSTTALYLISGSPHSSPICAPAILSRLQD